MFSEHIYSEIKPLFDLCSGILERGLINDLGYAAIRLRRIKNFKRNPNKTNSKLAIERGISDYLHCWNNRPGNELIGTTKASEIVNLEKEYLEDLHMGPIEKILLVMKDKSFIENTILQEPHRKATYKDVDNYLKCQDDYITFTQETNKIDRVIEINDAHDFIKKNLRNNY